MLIRNIQIAPILNRYITSSNFDGPITFKMSFEQFSLKQGKVFGKGKDTIGKFTLLGRYEEDGAIFFVKNYINGNGKVYTEMVNINIK